MIGGETRKVGVRGFGGRLVTMGHNTRKSQDMQQSPREVLAEGKGRRDVCEG